MKDPAILFYTSDFLTGCSSLTMDERGQYITLLCLQHQLGHLSEKTIRLSLGSVSVDVMEKFRKDESGNFYNERMESEILKRSQFIETRVINGKKGGRPKKNKKPSGLPNGLPSGKANENLIDNENEINKSKILNDYCILLGFDFKYVNEKSKVMFNKLLKNYGFEQIKEALRNGKNDSFWSEQFLSPLKLQTKDKSGVLYIDKFLKLIPKQNGKDKQNNSADRLVEQFADRVQKTMGNGN